jgi:uncharacterized protein (TIGR02678 family)
MRAANDDRRTEADPQAGGERRAAARHLLGHPLTCAEQHPEMFRLLRRHDTDLDRWFTQRLGYRLHIDTDTARLFKTGAIPTRRPLQTATDRDLTQREHTLLALVLAATAAGPSVISLRDLVGEVRSAAAEAKVTLPADSSGRRALVTVLRWMIDHGLAAELYERVDAFASDESTDAVLKMRPDRIALLLVPTTAGSETADELLQRAERRTATRQWMRVRLVEDPVLYRTDVTDEEWGELRRRLGEEERMLDEMFGLVLEARAEGVAAIDPDGSLTDRRFPAGGTIGHAALLCIERLCALGLEDDGWIEILGVEELLADLIPAHARRWSANMWTARTSWPDRSWSCCEIFVSPRWTARRYGCCPPQPDSYR